MPAPAGPRTTVNGFFADAYYGWTGFARVLHLVDRWAFGLNGRKGVFDRGDSSTQFLDPLLGVAGEGSLSSANKALLDVIETRNRGIVPGQRSSLSFGGIQSAIVDERAVNATLGYAFGRTAYGATLFYLEQSTNTLNIVDNLSPLPGAHALKPGSAARPPPGPPAARTASAARPPRPCPG